MSALGHKRTFRSAIGMSALPPKADVMSDRNFVVPAIADDTYDLIDRKLALPQYAASKQKVLEIFARRINASTCSLRGRGSIFSFDGNGYLKRIPAG